MQETALHYKFQNIWKDVSTLSEHTHQQVQHFLRQQQPDNQAVILNLLLIQQ